MNGYASAGGFASLFCHEQYRTMRRSLLSKLLVGKYSDLMAGRRAPAGTGGWTRDQLKKPVGHGDFNADLIGFDSDLIGFDSDFMGSNGI